MTLDQFLVHAGYCTISIYRKDLLWISLFHDDDDDTTNIDWRIGKTLEQQPPKTQRAAKAYISSKHARRPTKKYLHEFGAKRLISPKGFFEKLGDRIEKDWERSRRRATAS